MNVKNLLQFPTAIPSFSKYHFFNFANNFSMLESLAYYKDNARIAIIKKIESFNL